MRVRFFICIPELRHDDHISSQPYVPFRGSHLNSIAPDFLFSSCIRARFINLFCYVVLRKPQSSLGSVFLIHEMGKNWGVMRRLPGTEEMASAMKNTCRSCRGLELVSQHPHQGAGSQLELYLWRESMPLAAVGACIHALTTPIATHALLKIGNLMF